MLGKHEGQVYIQTSESFTPAQEKPAQFGVIGEKTTAQSTKSRQITWRPYLTSSPSRTPTVVTKDLAVWNPLDYPFGKGLLKEIVLKSFVGLLSIASFCHSEIKIAVTIIMLRLSAGEKL